MQKLEAFLSTALQAFLSLLEVHYDDFKKGDVLLAYTE